jgi:hypothetical protein
MPPKPGYQPTIEPVHTRPQQSTGPSALSATQPEPDTPEAQQPPVAPIPPPENVATQSKKVNKPPKSSGSGVGLAIVATVIIVLGLAALAVVAYIKTKK